MSSVVGTIKQISLLSIYCILSHFFQSSEAVGVFSDLSLSSVEQCQALMS